MRERNWRLIGVGFGVAVAAVGFFLWMRGLAPQSNDPVELMKTVGMVAGVVGGLGLVMAAYGAVGRSA